VKATGAELLLSNTYHLHLQPGEKIIKKLGGLHSFGGWSGPILTDSGGFQVFSLAKIRKITEEGVTFKDPLSGDKILITPEKSMQIQFDLGSDIIMAFDDLTGLDPSGRTRSIEAMERTNRWLERCIAEFNKLIMEQEKKPTKTRTSVSRTVLETIENRRPLLFGIVQGGLDKELRQKSLEFVQSTSVDGVAIGGLAVGETKAEMYEMLEFLAPLYDPCRVRHLMGVGDPPDMRFAIEHGIDMFDCVMPTRNGRHGQVWTNGDKRFNLSNLTFASDKLVIDKTCDCQTCQKGYSRALLRHLFKVGDPLAGSLASIHNLRYLARLCEEYREAQ
jgi:queuine tRNA-ribosyltransferase